MIRLQQTLSELTITDLFRIYNSRKDYIAFRIIVTNTGHITRVIRTNNYERYRNISKNGYSFIIPNEYELEEFVVKELKKKVNRISVAWGKYCYFQTFKQFLKKYGITESMYKKIKEI